MFACMLKCTCGGTVESLVDQIYYILTEDNCIIFRGVCNTCGENAQVKRDILSLIFLCPKGDKKGN